MVRTCNLSVHPSSHVKMTAELVLNLVWLAVAIYAAVRLTMWCSRQPRGSRKIWTGIIATACLVALLFPIISVTDDLSNDGSKHCRQHAKAIAAPESDRDAQGQCDEAGERDNRHDHFIGL